MADELRITQAVIQVDVADATDGPLRITQAVVNVDVADVTDYPLRITQAVVQVDVKEPYVGAGATFGPLVQVM